METTCVEDLQEVAVEYCACKFPLVALCRRHAEKHLSDSHTFHFPLPLPASELIPSQEVYLEVKQWLSQLNTNYDFLREKLQLLGTHEAEIETAYQELLHFAYTTKERLKQEFSVRKEGFRAEIEKAIEETRTHALDDYEPVDSLSKLLWHSPSRKLVSTQLFTFKAECVKENLTLTFQIALKFAQGLDHLDMGKGTLPMNCQVEELTKQLSRKPEIHDTQGKCLPPELAQTTKPSKSQKNRPKETELSLKLQETEDQLNTLKTENQALNTRYLVLKAETEAIVKQFQVQMTQLTDSKQNLDIVMKENAQLQAKIRKLDVDMLGTAQQFQTLWTDLEAKYDQCAALKADIRTLEEKGRKKEPEETISQIMRKNEKLEARLANWGITMDPPHVSQKPIPDYSTPKSRYALASFGPYLGRDDELLLVRGGPVADKKGVYIGQWNTRNEKHGYGTFFFKDGNVYEGQWRNDFKTGRGRYIWADGSVYIGDFLQNQKHGFGSYYFDDGSVYVGEWVNGKMQGFGAKTYGADSHWPGDHYFGEFSNDDRSGIGTCASRNGNVFIGEWKADRFQGEALMRNFAGATYFGECINRVPSGMGFCVYPNGDVYDGEWKGGRRNGKGRLTHPGRVEEGFWINDQLRRFDMLTS